MRSQPVAAGDTGRIEQHNDLRKDAYAASWLLAHEQDIPDLTLYVEPGNCYVNGTLVEFAGGNTGTFAAPVTNPRIDVLSIDNTGALVITSGAENPSPTPPETPENNVSIAIVYNRVGQVSVKDTDDTTNGYIESDTRPFLFKGAEDYYFGIANENLAAGDPVGVGLISGGVSLAALLKKTFSTLTNIKKIRHLVDNKFVVAYTPSSNTLGAIIEVDSNNKQINVLSSGVTLTAASSTDVTFDLCVYSSNGFATFTRNAVGTNVEVRTFSVTGSIIAFVANSLFATGDPESVSVVCVSNNKIIGNYLTSNTTKFFLMTFSSNVPTLVATSTAVSSQPWDDPSKGCKVEDSKAIFITRDGETNKKHVIVVTAPSSTLTVGSSTPVLVDGNSSQEFYFIEQLSDNLVVANLGQTSDAIFPITTSGTTPTFGSAVNFTSATATGFVKTSNTSGVLSTSGSTFSVVSTAGVLSIANTDEDLGVTQSAVSTRVAFGGSASIIANENEYYLYGMSGNFIGFSVGTYSSGETAIVKLRGVNRQQSSLTPGTKYSVVNSALIADIDGRITATSPTSVVF